VALSSTASSRPDLLAALAVAPAARRGAPLRSYNKKTVDIDPEVRQGTTPVVEFDADELSAKLNATFDDAKRNWDRLDEKPAAVALTASILVGLWVRRAACSALLGAAAGSPASIATTAECCRRFVLPPVLMGVVACVCFNPMHARVPLYRLPGVCVSQCA